jgi:sterol desaturase/sphingolipid hydroxylase (fatty acid hydroxylase superfamily)
MRVNAKTTSIFAVSSATVMAGLVFLYHEFYSISGSPTDIFKLISTYVWEVLRALGSTAIGRLGTLVVLVLVVDAFFLGWRGSSLFRLIFSRRKSAIVDISYFVLMLLNVTAFFEIAFTLGASVLASKFIAWVSSHYGWSRITLPSDGVFEIAGGLAVYWLMTSFVQYWGHRLMHTPIFWHLHRFHHAATELNTVTAFRIHPLESVVLRPLLLVSPLIFFNIPGPILLVYFFLGTISDLLAHSQLPWTFGAIGRWLIQSPRVHQVHHSIEDEHQNLHFSICPLWDHLFGTWYKGTKLPSKFGIPDPAYEARPLTQFVLDVWIFYVGLARWICLPLRRLGLTGTSSPPAATTSRPASNGVATGS